MLKLFKAIIFVFLINCSSFAEITFLANFNATVDENLDRYLDYYFGYNARVNPLSIVDTYGVGDFVRFYVVISDLSKDKSYEISITAQSCA